ncbi:probable nucleoredoxin 1 isoform X2 [Daucus carota subsp. sativus]|uniref:probable nucleoredoxin 1 isoform X2 n=1 Tax=Daucus carota subsp. sativus TaxID=79200 RepID=UPI0007F02EDD|nr:PREDICTED: probable nucleoredoxin 1 isoform X2 [Daucus carota subsp. sativus]
MGFSILHRRSSSSSFAAYVKSNLIKFTGRIRNITIPEEPTSNLLSLDSSPRTPVLEVRSFGSPDDSSAMSLPLAKYVNLINGYGCIRVIGVENMRKGPHFNLIPARNYTKISEDVDEQTWKVEGRGAKGYMSASNFPDILFTEYRDYLVKYNGQRVHVDQLAGKVVVLFFVPLTRFCSYTKRCMISLVDTYNYLQQNNNFEVVFIAVDSRKKEIRYGRRIIEVEPSKHFEELFSCMPWTAIPLSDITARKHVQQRFGISDVYHNAIVIGTNGEILQTNSCTIFETYGGQGYPFTDAKILSLKSQDDTIAKNPSLEALLASPERDYVISNKGDKVPIHTLEEKVVALYFYEDGSCGQLTEKLKMAYKELAKKKENFEVVLIYLYDTICTDDRTDEGSFWEKFKTMPWLALPYRDPNYRKLLRLFCFPREDSLCFTTTLVIVGPRGEFIEPWGACMLTSYNIEAFPFTREKVAHLLIEKVKELKLEKLWDPNTVFKGKNATKLSQLAGKRIILFFEGHTFDEGRVEFCVEFLRLLKEMYLDMKDTDDEFEVIHISNSKNESCYVEDVPWLVSPATELLPADYRLYCCFCRWTQLHPDIGNCLPGDCHGNSSILAFDQDGRLVRKSISLTIEHRHFPFYGGSMEKEAFFDYNEYFDYNEFYLEDGYLQPVYQGLLRNSYCHHDRVPYLENIKAD